MKKYLIPLFFVFLGCGEHSIEDMFDDIINNLGTGLQLGNMELVPQDVKNFSEVSAANFETSVSLEDKFPPVQSQGNYGTCAAWSTGYAFKTALNAIDKNWTKADLAKASNQTSPKDVWLATPTKNSGCGGAAFEYVMDGLIAKGAASMEEVPYNMANSCDAKNAAKGNQNNKLANYRKIAYFPEVAGSTGKKEGMTIENFKTYLAQGRPVLIGAKLGDRFDRWKSSDVLSYDTYTTARTMHALHAMVLVGYDDSRGMGKGAFRVRNSWGDDWGDKGSIWVDYDFFLESFCWGAYVAQNPNSSSDNPNPPVSNTTDLLARFAEDYPDTETPNNPRARAFSYEIYNNGSTKILASQKWSVYYMYYNAYNADDYEIIFEDYYTNEYGSGLGYLCTSGKKDCKGETEAIEGGFWNNMNVEPGKMAGEAEAGDNKVFEMAYEMPAINGDYYLLVYADPMEVIKEDNEDNNFYFITSAGGKPLKFAGGVMQSTPANQVASTTALSKRAKPAPVHSVVDLGELNAYTPQEIKIVLNRDKKSGVLAKKIAQYREKAKPVKRIKAL